MIRSRDPGAGVKAGVYDFNSKSRSWMSGFGTESDTVFGPDSSREKKLERKRKNLIRLGVKQGMAYAWSRTRMGGWAVAQSPVLGTTITLSRLRKRGFERMLDYYLKV